MADEKQQPKLSSTAAAGKKNQQARRPQLEAHNGGEHQKAASDGPSAAVAGITKPSKHPTLAKPHAASALSQGAAAAAGSKSGVSRTGSIKRHGSTTSRRLQALLASEELSSLSLLGTEGSELPGMCAGAPAPQDHFMPRWAAVG
jgi:hypothetical protein